MKIAPNEQVITINIGLTPDVPVEINKTAGTIMFRVETDDGKGQIIISGGLARGLIDAFMEAAEPEPMTV